MGLTVGSSSSSWSPKQEVTFWYLGANLAWFTNVGDHQSPHYPRNMMHDCWHLRNYKSSKTSPRWEGSPADWKVGRYSITSCNTIRLFKGRLSDTNAMCTQCNFTLIQKKRRTTQAAIVESTVRIMFLWETQNYASIKNVSHFTTRFEYQYVCPTLPRKSCPTLDY